MMAIPTDIPRSNNNTYPKQQNQYVYFGGVRNVEIHQIPCTPPDDNSTDKQSHYTNDLCGIH